MRCIKLRKNASILKVLCHKDPNKLITLLNNIKEKQPDLYNLIKDNEQEFKRLLVEPINQEDINFDERECIVFGKGDKERIVYFDARTKMHLKTYLDSRDDDNPALFVSLTSPHNRMKIGGIEVRLRKIGNKLGIPKVHPHKFRRTLATMAIDKGMPIEQLQKLLGHSRIDTTLQYAMVKQSNVKLAHKKYIG